MEKLYAIVDRDGVLRRESEVLPGVVDLYQAFLRLEIGNVLLSNNSRVTSDGIWRWMKETCGLRVFEQNQAMTSAEAAANYFKQMDGEPRPFLIGEKGLWDAFSRVDIHAVNMHWGNNRWLETPPTHVVKGFKNTNMDYLLEEAPAWNALAEQGAQLISTNPDVSYRNAAGLRVPANGAQIRCFHDVAPNPITLGKPEVGMAEVALKRMGVDKATAQVKVIGDTIAQDLMLAKNLRDDGWNADCWLVLTGDTDPDQAKTVEDEPGVRIFQDIREITQMLLDQ